MPQAPENIHRVAILGVGLIGGSLGLALRRSLPTLEICGYDRPEVLDRAVAAGAIDVPAASPQAAVQEAQLVILATPLPAMLRLLEVIADDLPAGIVVTDVGSVKGPVMAHAQATLPDHVTFIGGHPMAGAAYGGIEHADALLFENATYVLCPPGGMGEEALAARYPGLLSIVRATGARVRVLGADRHDRIAAAVSHLPQLLAVLLTDYVAALHAHDDAYLSLAAGGFRDMTRVAASPFDLWEGILAANHGPILDTLAAFAADLQRCRNRLAGDDYDDLRARFDRAREAREAIPRDTRGFLQPLSDVYVYAEDRPGELARITTSLHRAGLNIKDMELLKIREGTGGAFRLGFDAATAAESAVETLQGAGFTAYRLQP